MAICDLVADDRAPAPSAAAGTATAARDDLRRELRKVSMRIGGAARALVRARADDLRHFGRDLTSASVDQVSRRRGALQEVAGRLHALSPVATLARGYAVARDENGGTLSDRASFRDDMPFDLIVRDGVVPARVRPSSEDESA